MTVALQLLRHKAQQQREMVQWWAAECRQRNRLARRRFTNANVARCTEGRATLRRYATAWLETRNQIKLIHGDTP